MILNTALWPNGKSWVTPSDRERSVWQSGGMRCSAADIREPNISGGDVPLCIALSSTRAPTMQRACIRAAGQEESHDGSECCDTRNHLTRIRRNYAFKGEQFFAYHGFGRVEHDREGIRRDSWVQSPARDRVSGCALIENDRRRLNQRPPAKRRTAAPQVAISNGVCPSMMQPTS